MNQVGDYYPNSVTEGSDILEAECSHHTVPGKDIKLPSWGSKHEVCSFHDQHPLMFTSCHLEQKAVVNLN